MTKARRGVYAAAISPISADGSLDVSRLIDYVKYLLANGCDGVAPLGTTGQGTSLGLRDRLAVPVVFAQAGIAPDRVIFGTGAASLADTAALCSACLTAGYPNVLVLPPFYYKTSSEEGLYAYYAALIERVRDPRLRLYLYHFPQMSAVPIPVDLAARLRATFGPIVAGLKDSSGDLDQSRAFLTATGGMSEGFDVYFANEASIIEAMEAGCAGVISGSTNAFAPLVQRVLALAGDERDEALGAVRAARDAVMAYSLIPAVHQIQAWRSGDPAWTRLTPPLMPLSEAERTALRADLEAMKLLLSSAA